MLLAILLKGMRITTRIFFRNITIRNKELIPSSGPLLILANHPGTFMDPIVIATLLKRNLFFLAKGELFKGKFAKWMLRKLNMIPVYRKQDDPTKLSKNRETFEACFTHFEKGGALLLFPEGTSRTERKLRPLKTGAARIALEAEAKNNFLLNIKLITIGLNYENPHKFNRNLFVNISSPIQVSDYKELYAQDNFNAVESLTETIRLQLEKLIISNQDDRIDSFTKKIEILYKIKLSKDLGISEKDIEADFRLTKNISTSVTYFVQHHVLLAQQTEERINEYLINLNRLGLQDADLNFHSKSKSLLGNSIRALLFICIGFPLYIYGLLTNYLPFKIPGWIADKTAKEIQFRGAIAMVTGFFIFILFYTFQIALTWNYFHSVWITLIVFASFPLAGFFAYHYFYEIAELRAKWILMQVFYKKSKVISKLITEREELIDVFDKARAQYLAQIKTG